jgi:hypothetical protein
MVYVDSEQQESGQVAIAESIAKRFGASLLGVSAAAVEPPFVAEGVIIEQTTEEDVKRMKAGLSAKEVWFRRVVRLPSEAVEWRWALDYPTDFLVEQARAADLVVVKRKPLTASHSHFFDPSGAMLRMGRPTLSVPERVKEFSGDRIVIGWKELRKSQSRRSVRRANRTRLAGGFGTWPTIFSGMGCNASTRCVSIRRSRMAAISSGWRPRLVPT